MTIKTYGNTEILSQENLYDSTGQRIQKIDKQGEQTKTKNYYYDGSQVVATTDENGIETSFNLIAPDGIIGTVRYKEDHIYLYNRDDLGSTTSILNPQGSIVSNYEYDDYGELIDEDSNTTFDNEILYTGQIYDDSTGLYYYNARYYDSSVGSFTTQDTYRGSLTDPTSLNLYTYCAGDPINNTDPTGYKAKKTSSTASKAKKTASKKSNNSSVKKADNIKTQSSGNIKSNTNKKPTGKIDKKIKQIINKLEKTIKKAGYKAASKFVTKLSGLTKKEHYNRNKNQKDVYIPKTKKEMEKLVKKGLWTECDKDAAKCHQFNTKNDQPNHKYISADGHYEVVYYSDGTINNTAEDRGTYNYCNYKKDPLGHFTKDILPWILWGNSSKDKTTRKQRISSLFA